MKKRSVAAVVILNIITCGIYGVYWGYVACRDLQKESGVSKIPPIATMLLLLFVSAAGGALLGYDCNETVNAIKEQRGVNKSDNLVLWIVLGVLLPVVTMALVQNEINQLPERIDPQFDPFAGMDQDNTTEL